MTLRPDWTCTFLHHLHSLWNITLLPLYVQVKSWCQPCPGTHFTAGWMDGPFLPVPKALINSVIFRLPISCCTYWSIGALQFDEQVNSIFGENMIYLILLHESIPLKFHISHLAYNGLNYCLKHFTTIRYINFHHKTFITIKQHLDLSLWDFPISHLCMLEEQESFILIQNIMLHYVNLLKQHVGRKFVFGPHQDFLGGP